MKKQKRYEIKTIEQLINITSAENFERLGTDLLLWINHINQAFKEIRENNSDFKNKQNHEIFKIDTFIWIDDGKNDIKNIQLKNTTTGEVTNIKPNKKRDK